MAAAHVRPRPDEAHRASTPLELLFDLTFVVAVARAASQLHHALAEGQAGHELAGYAVAFVVLVALLLAYHLTVAHQEVSR